MTSRDHKSTGKNHSGKDRHERQLDDELSKAVAALATYAKEIAWADMELSKGFKGVAELLAENAADKLIKTIKTQCPGNRLIEVVTGKGKNGIVVEVRYVDSTTTITINKKPG